MNGTLGIRERIVLAGLGCALALAGCAGPVPAPVIERAGPPAKAPAAAKPAPARVPAAVPEAASPVQAHGREYVVRKGDTLHGIALELGVDYRDLVTWNRIANPDVIYVGQRLKIEPPAGGPVVVKPIELPAGAQAHAAGESGGPDYKREPKGGKQPYSEAAWARMQQGAPAATVAPAPRVETAPAPPPAAPAPAAASGIEWVWPASGKILNGFREPSNKGIDIAGEPGEPVLAAAAGKVIYAGSNVRGYGNLVVVKHNDQFLSAYAHNRRILVKESQTVERGQKIAELGDSDADQAKLHFEIRLQSKPVDPLRYLPARKP
ncbi:MAG: peptidoglycan DD-metalloendopeptidase family protein [Rhodocyclaceae bacterium]